MNNAENNIGILKGLTEEIRMVKQIRLYDQHIEEASGLKDLVHKLPEKVMDLYGAMNGFTLEWRHKNYAADPVLKGLCRFLPVEEMNRSGKGIVWFDTTPDNDPLRDFVIIDFFVDEACAGVYKNSADPSLYFYGFEGKPQSLHLDMDGYIKMLAAARCFWYWQLVLLDLHSGEEHTETAQFKKHMPLIFEGFTFEGFEQLYQSIKLK